MTRGVVVLALDGGNKQMPVGSVQEGSLILVNRQQAPLTPDDAAPTVVRAAMLDDAAPSGTFIDVNGPVR